MSKAAIKFWDRLHTWSSIVCTVVLLAACVSGLPILFEDEVDAIFVDAPAALDLNHEHRDADLDEVLKRAEQLKPGSVPSFVGVDDDFPQISVGMRKGNRHGEPDGSLLFDARSGQPTKEAPPGPFHAFFDFFKAVHFELFLGFKGRLVLCVMALTFVVSLVSGAVLYAPFARGGGFGTVRRHRQRTKWLDRHNLIGIVLLAWALVIGVTGAMNSVTSIFYSYWQATEVPKISAPYQGLAEPPRLSSLQKAVRAAEAAVPNTRTRSIFFPTSQGIGTPHHYLVWLQGRSLATRRIYTAVFVDAKIGSVTTTAGAPWYLRCLDLSRPLHFGDYGGLALKLIWALLDLLTIVLLGSGLYLWINRIRRGARKQANMPALPTLDTAC